MDRMHIVTVAVTSFIKLLKCKTNIVSKFRFRRSSPSGPNLISIDRQDKSRYSQNLTTNQNYIHGCSQMNIQICYTRYENPNIHCRFFQIFTLFFNFLHFFHIFLYFRFLRLSLIYKQVRVLKSVKLDYTTRFKAINTLKPSFQEDICMGAM